VQHNGLTSHDPADGRILWAKGPAWDDNRSSVHQRPAIDEARVYCLVTPFMGAYGVAAHGRKDGTPVWMRRLDRLPKEYPEPIFQSHFPSPVLADNLLVVPGIGDRLAVLDTEHGHVLWERPVLRREGPASAIHPSSYYVLKEHAHGLTLHGDVIYATTTNGCAFAVDLQTGRKRWEFFTPRPPLLDFQPYFRGRGNLLTAPLVVGERLLTGGADGHLYALNASDGTLAAESDYRCPLTVSPTLFGRRVLVSCFDGRVHCYDIAGASS
jgi:outer membrane protein assembly factor BamB